MRYVDVGGEHLSVIGVGAWQFGSRDWAYGKEYADTTAIDIVHRALDLGVNVIDTAEVYGFGNSERIVGRAIAGRRADAFVASKLLPVVPPIGAGFIEARASKSLGRLGIDTIDLYQVHWPNPALPTRDDGRRTAAAARRRASSATSASATTRAPVAGARSGRSARRSCPTRCSTASPRASPSASSCPSRRPNDRLVIAYSPLAQGLLGAKYDAVERAEGRPAATTRCSCPRTSSAPRRCSTRCARSPTAHDATPAQVALAWVIRRPNVIAIPGASSVAQLEANVAAARSELTDDEDRRLTEASDRFHPIRGAAAVPKLVAGRLKR